MYITRALLPHLVKFAYIPRTEVQIHGDAQLSHSKREKSPDFSRYGSNQDPGLIHDCDEHVLVLDFEESSRGNKPMANGCVQRRYGVA